MSGMTRKVHPITGRHTTMQSMAAEIVGDDRAKSGIIVFFDEEGTMHFGEMKLTLGQACMAQGFMAMIVNQMMSED
jgi:hypothetical protein